jgi:uncharacterized membrane protein
MRPLVVALVLASTVMHAGWNLLARFERNERVFYGKMLLATAGLGFVPAAWSELATRSLGGLAWACAFGSALCNGLYFYFLARAYERSDFTIVYPLARALPVIFVAFADVGRGRLLSAGGWVGICLVMGGCLLSPLPSFSLPHLAGYFNRANLWTLLAAVGTLGYTLLDKLAVETLPTGIAAAARYEYFCMALSYLPYRWLLKANSDQLGPDRPPAGFTQWLARQRLATPAALLCFGAYCLILWAYQLSPQASYIVAFRQFSIVLGTIVAFRAFKEPGLGVRLSGALLITAGLVLIAAWGH